MKNTFPKGGPKAATVAKATMLSLCICAFLFVAQTWLASLFVLGRTNFAQGDATNAAFYDIATTVGGYWLKFLLTVPGTFFAGIAGALTAQAATARLLYGMARGGKLPRLLAAVSPRKVPRNAILRTSQSLGFFRQNTVWAIGASVGMSCGTRSSCCFSVFGRPNIATCLGS